MKIKIGGDIIADDDKWIYEWFGLDATCPKDVSDQLEKANGEPVDVYINSPGGSVFAGVEIYDALQRYQGEVRLHGIWAASAASVILCAGHSDMSPSGMVMIHNVSGTARGDYRVMDKNSEILKTANQAVCAAYVQKTGKSEEELLRLMDAETWYTAQQAVELGLVDEVFQAQPRQMSATTPGGLPYEVIEKIRATVKNPFSDKPAVDKVLAARLKMKLLELKGDSVL